MYYKVAARKASPPVEIVTLDYNSTDGIADYALNNGNVYLCYAGRDYYHAAHANNLAMLLGSGEWVVLVPADIYLKEGYMTALREQIAQGAVWCNTDRKRRSTIAIRKDEFIAAGGYDERMEMYGPDDLDLIKRLERRGCKRGVIPDEFLTEIYTSPEKKVANYRLKGMSHKELGELSIHYYYENVSKGQLVANEDVEWGKF
jgi:hypothetical protein